MGLFKKSTNKKSREINEYNILEEYDINLNENSNLIEKIGETNKFIFYIYKPENDIFRGKYFLRQNKDNPKKIVYFGSKPAYECLFNEYLFYANNKGEIGKHDYITARNIENGKIISFNWLGKNGNYIYINGYGRPYNQDTINNMYIKDNKLVIDVHREKGSIYNETDRNYDMDYTIEVEYKNESFNPIYIYNDEEKDNNKKDIIDVEKYNNNCNLIFNNSMNTINNMNKIMTDFDAKLLIEKDEETFIMKTFLVCLYFYNINLQKNGSFNKDIRNKMYDALIDEMCNRTKIQFELAQKDYIVIRDLLDNVGDTKLRRD